MNVDKFKEKLKTEGRSLVWFYKTFIVMISDLTYSGFTQQLNDYAPISKEIQKKIDKFMEVQ